MSTKHTLEFINGITAIRFSSAPTFAETKEVIDKLAKENSYHLRVWDFSGVKLDFTMDEIRLIAEYGKSKFLQKNFLAAVAPQDGTYGMLRAFEVYRAEEGQSSVRIFRTEPEALEWLADQQKFLYS